MKLRRHGAFAVLILTVACAEDPTTSQQKTPAPIDSPDAVVKAVASAYREQDPDLLRSILAHDGARNAEYLFRFGDPTRQGETQWGYAEEARIHRRMFTPRHLLENELPVPTELWLDAVDIHLTPLEAFEERMDLYSADHGADGKLDPDFWRIVDARYGTDVFFDTQGQQSPDFQVSGVANFIVIEDKTRRVGEKGRFLLFIWEDVGYRSKSSGPGAKGSSAMSWARMKSLYR